MTLLSLINTERTRAGVPPLRQNMLLDAAAVRHANDMADRQRGGHDGSDGSTFVSRVVEAGYRYSAIAENAAETWTDDPAECVRAWMSSPGHRANMLNDDYIDAGCGMATNGGSYWCLVLASPAVSKPVPPRPTIPIRPSIAERILRWLRIIPVIAWVWTCASDCVSSAGPSWAVVLHDAGRRFFS